MTRSALLFVVALGLLAVSAAQAAKPDKTDGDSTTVSEASTCQISQQCWDGSTVSCSGPAGTCTSGSTWVSCNGTQYNCPSTSCSARVRCALGSTIACTGTYYCEEGSDYVYCQGTGTLTCDECYPRRYCSIP